MTKARDLASGAPAPAGVTTTELGFVDGVTSAIQTQLGTKAATSHNHDTTYVGQATFDAKGDLIVGTGNDAYARLGVGSTGDTIVADSSTATGLRYQGSQAAGKNYVINGAMDFFQRATISSSSGYTTADRWYFNASNSSTVSRESTIVPTGYQYSLKLTANATNANPYILQPIETVLSLGLVSKTVTISFWAYASTSLTINTELLSSTSVDNPGASAWISNSPTSGGSATVSTSWTKIRATFTAPANGKTFAPYIFLSGGIASGASYYITGVQLEIGSVATEFSRAGGTIQGELAACQRYYVRYSSPNNYAFFGNGTAATTTSTYIQIPLPVEMRVIPTSIDTTTAGLYRLQFGSSSFNVTSLAISTIGDGTKVGCLSANVASGLTANGFYQLLGNFSSSAFIGFSAEL